MTLSSQQLMIALAAEARSLATQIASMGEAMSTGKSAKFDIQHFDPMAQRAAALADLLQGLAEGEASLETLIASVPFQDLRQRLRGAKPIAATSNETEWF